MKVYFDTCCWNRKHDDQRQAKIRAESVAIMDAIEACLIGGHYIVGSAMVVSEILDAPETDLRDDIIGFYRRTVNGSAEITEKEEARAQALWAQGLGKKDSVHLAAAEVEGVDVLITVDADFERISTDKKLSVVTVINPLKFSREV